VNSGSGWNGPEFTSSGIAVPLFVGGIVVVPFASQSEENRGLTDVRAIVRNPADPSRFQELEFLVDSGAIYSVVPRNVLLGLGIQPDDVESFSLADMTPIRRKIGEAAFTFRGRTRSSPVMFGEEGDATLLGVMTLESLGLMLDPVKQEVRKMQLRV
jgi:clan AA aspartic protease